MSTPFRLVLPTQLYHDMLAQARAELPNECCGLLGGRIVADGSSPGSLLGQVQRRFPLVNELGSPTEFLSEPKSLIQAMRDQDALGLDLLAIYHSHPTTEPVPSKKDLERNYSPEVLNLIISLQGEPVHMRGWWLAGEEFREAEWVLEPLLPFLKPGPAGGG